MDVLYGEPGSSNNLCLTSKLDGNVEIGIEVERLTDISELVDQQTTTIPALQMEPNVRCVPVLQMALELPSYNRRNNVCSEPSLIASKPRSINDLPLEILLNILSYFRPEEICYTIANVCERWKVVSKEVVLWKKLSYECDGHTDIEDIAEVLTNAPALHSLTIFERNNVVVILEFLNHIRDLRKLNIHRCYLDDNGYDLLPTIVDLFPDLEALSLTQCGLLPSDGYCLIGHLKKLVELDLSYSDVHYEYFKPLEDYFRIRERKYKNAKYV